MLGKLLKYELRATSRIFLPLFAILLLFTGINRISMAFDSSYNSPVAQYMDGMGYDILNFAQGIAMMIYVAVIVAMFVMTVVITVQRFNRNLLSDEGYLMNTLPVTADQHMISKLLISMFWQIASVLVSFLSIFLLTVDQNFIRFWNEFWQETTRMFQTHGSTAWTILFEFIFMMITSLFFGSLIIYASIMLGSQLKKHRMLASFGAYMVLWVISSTVFNLVSSLVFPANRSIIVTNSFDEVANSLMQGLFFMIVMTALFSIGLYFLTRWLLQNKLNLE